MMYRKTMNAMALAVLTSALAFAHCDGLDGPVVKAAREALATGDVSRAMPWVRPADEPAIKEAFAKTLKVRKLSSEAESLADMWFYETVVRLHRAGEGAPYEGLKPAGRDLGPAIPAADKAIETGNIGTLAEMLSGSAREELRRRFQRVVDAKGYQRSDVKAGREYVAAYVDFLHFTERLHQLVSGSGGPADTHEH